MIVRGVVNLVLTLCTPPQPNACLNDEPEAFAFARDKCTVIKVWVPAKKLRRSRTVASNGPLSLPSGDDDGGSPSPGEASTTSSPRRSPRALFRSATHSGASEENQG